MKKLLLALMFLVPGFSYAVEGVPDVVTTLIEHVSPTTQIISGATKIGLMDSVVLIGKVNGASILDLQAGYLQDTVSGTDGSFVLGGFCKISSFLKDKIQFKDEWLFLKAIEHGPFYSYNFKEHHGFGGYQIGLAFSLNPVK